MLNRLKLLALATLLASPASAFGQTAAAKPTIVLVHGAFAESSSWDPVIERLSKHGYRVIAAANALRGVKSDAATISALVKATAGPVVLVGHSYGGPVITEAANGNPNVKALVYVAGFAPETGESSLQLSGKFPGSTLGGALTAVDLPDGGKDLYIRSDKFHAQFAADIPADRAAVLSATQRPVKQSALEEPSGTPSWKRLPSYVIYGSADLNIPPAALKFMADRAASRKTVVVDGASHVVMLSHPDKVASLIEDAASAP
jgi:pimeloyl-ACP methyl ester carboxylesterase